MRGCLLGGAVGDALGAPVEFAPITSRSEGVTGFPTGRAEVTDDTQMTLFTAEGLIRASVGSRRGGASELREAVWRAYLRWLHTQQETLPGNASKQILTGWLIGQRSLHHRRAPGNTCLGALRSGRAGTRTARINDSKGCGGVMRAAPAGLVAASAEEAFQIGCDLAAITHGHPSGYLSAGALAAIVWHLRQGSALEPAADAALALLEREPERDHEETSRRLRQAMQLAAAGGVPTPPELNRVLGEGWVGEEALAIALCCALSAGTTSEALLAAVNHAGDSDSTGSICGNLVGTLHGEQSIPTAWVTALDVGHVVAEVADDLVAEFFPASSDTSVAQGDAGALGPLRERPQWLERYPPD